MTATVEEVLALADVKQCLKDTGVESTYNHCHSACTWLIIQIKKANLSDYNIAWCVGTFWANDHSWLIVQDAETGEETIIDMTVNQFVDRKVPWSGPMNDQYHIFDSALLCDGPKLCELVQATGA